MDFPAPLAGEVDHFCFEVSKAISNEYFIGEVEFFAYGDELTVQERMNIRRAGIWLVQEGKLRDSTSLVYQFRRNLAGKMIVIVFGLGEH